RQGGQHLYLRLFRPQSAQDGDARSSEGRGRGRRRSRLERGPLPVQRPRLRPVETVLVPDPRFGQSLMLRDTEGVTSKVATVPGPLIPILARFAGSLKVEEIAALVSKETGAEVPVDVVRKLADELDEALFLDSSRYQAERRRVELEFSNALVRPA